MTCSRSFASEDNTLEHDSPVSSLSATDWFTSLAESLDQPALRKKIQSISAASIEDYYRRLTPAEQKDMGSLEDFVAITRRHWSLGGPYIQRLAEYVDVVFDKLLGEPWNSVPIGLLPTPSFNASAVAVNDGKAILLNFGMVGHLRMFWKAFLGFASYGQTPPAPAPMCMHLKLFDFAISMALEVVVLKSGQYEDWPNSLAAQGCTHCSATHWEHYADSYIALSELFVIFHEIAHISLGHLDNSIAVTAMESQRQEYAADEWAVRRLLACNANDKGHANDVALCAGVFLVAAELIGDSRVSGDHQTHPMADLRRERVNELCGVAMNDGSAAGELHRLVPQIYPLCIVAHDLFSSILRKQASRETLSLLVKLLEIIHESGVYSDAANSTRRALWLPLVTKSGIKGWDKAC